MSRMPESPVAGSRWPGEAAWALKGGAMNRVRSMCAVYATMALLLGACSKQVEQPQVADIVLTNGYVYVADEDRIIAEAIAISGNRILAVGTNDAIRAYIGSGTEVRDLQGKMVMPGLHDMHTHALGSVPPDMCDLDGAAYSLAELVPVIRTCIAEHGVADGEWVPVLQWNPYEGNQPSAEYPTLRAALDAASGAHPIIMWGADGHHGAVNSLALRSAQVPIDAGSLKGVHAQYADRIAVDDTGEPTGSLIRDARNLVRPDMDADMLGVSTPSPGLMPRVAEKMAASGITSLQDAAVTEAILDHYLWLAQNGGLTFRLRTALAIRPDAADPDVDAVAKATVEGLDRLREKARGVEHIDASAIKILADGVLEGNPHADPPTLPGAAMIDGFHQPMFALDESDGSVDVTGYVDMDSAYCRQVRHEPAAFAGADAVAQFRREHGHAPSQCIKQFGKLTYSEALLGALVREATKAGYHVHIHALADHAVKASADAFEAVKPLADANGLTQSIAHLQIGKPDDVRRLGELGTYVAFTYLWAKPMPAYEMTVVPFIDRVAGREDLYNPAHYYMQSAYPFRSVLQSGGIPVFGSDTPVGSRDPRPFASMAVAVTREADGIVLNAAERLDIHQAIASYTRNGAKMMGREDELGTLQAGKRADVIVLDRNIVELAEGGTPDTIGETKVLTTFFDGKIVHDVRP